MGRSAGTSSQSVGGRPIEVKKWFSTWQPAQASMASLRGRARDEERPRRASGRGRRTQRVRPRIPPRVREPAAAPFARGHDASGQLRRVDAVVLGQARGLAQRRVAKRVREPRLVRPRPALRAPRARSQACAFPAERVCNPALRLRFPRKAGSQSCSALLPSLTSGFAILP